MFTAGRYEYRNKGVDMFIESLARLNYRLQKANSPVTVVAFIIMPAATSSYTIEALKGQAVIKQLHDTVIEIQQRMGQRLFEKASRYQSYALFTCHTQYTNFVLELITLTSQTWTICCQTKTKSFSSAVYLP
jgi:hypothetical protein